MAARREGTGPLSAESPGAAAQSTPRRPAQKEPPLESPDKVPRTGVKTMFLRAIWDRLRQVIMTTLMLMMTVMMMWVMMMMMIGSRPGHGRFIARYDPRYGGQTIHVKGHVLPGALVVDRVSCRILPARHLTSVLCLLEA